MVAAQYDILLYDLHSELGIMISPRAILRLIRQMTLTTNENLVIHETHRPDCVQVLIAMIITPESFPLIGREYPRQDHAQRDFKDD